MPAVAGLIVGVLHAILRLPSRLPGFIEDLEDGRVEPKTAPGAVLVALVSLVGGTSLGPEAPLAQVSAAQRRGDLSGRGLIPSLRGRTTKLRCPAYSVGFSRPR